MDTHTILGFLSILLWFAYFQAIRMSSLIFKRRSSLLKTVSWNR